MNTKKIFIVRHGQTDFNKKNMVQGSGIDAPLNPFGRRQAQRFYEAFAKEPFQKVYISDLQRTYQSVEEFIRNGIPFERLSGLNEISWGSQEGKPFSETSSALYHDTVRRWSEGDLDANVGGGESPNQVMERQRQAIDHILANNHENHILICMHGRAMRILLAWMMGYSLSKMDQFEHTNLGLYELTFTGSIFRIDRYNDTSHLVGLFG